MILILGDRCLTWSFGAALPGNRKGPYSREFGVVTMFYNKGNHLDLESHIPMDRNHLFLYSTSCLYSVLEQKCTNVLHSTQVK